jgi:hypothetical protein
MSKLVRKTLAESPLFPARRRRAGPVGSQTGDGNRLLGHSAAGRELLEKRRAKSLLSADKAQLTMRLDADIVAWLRKQGRGYQTRMNKVLRDAMLEDSKRAPDHRWVCPHSSKVPLQ